MFRLRLHGVFALTSCRCCTRIASFRPELRFVQKNAKMELPDYQAHPNLRFRALNPKTAIFGQKCPILLHFSPCFELHSSMLRKCIRDEMFTNHQVVLVIRSLKRMLHCRLIDSIDATAPSRSEQIERFCSLIAK